MVADSSIFGPTRVGLFTGPALLAAEDGVADAVPISRGVVVLETADWHPAMPSTDSSPETGRLVVSLANAPIVAPGACATELDVSLLSFISAAADGAGFASAHADPETDGGSEAGMVPPADAAGELDVVCANESTGGLLRTVLLVSSGSVAAIFTLSAEPACGGTESDAVDGLSGEAVDVGVCGWLGVELGTLVVLSELPGVAVAVNLCDEPGMLEEDGSGDCSSGRSKGGNASIRSSKASSSSSCRRVRSPRSRQLADFSWLSVLIVGPPKRARFC